MSGYQESRPARALVAFAILATAEVALVGVPLLRARSLGSSDILGGYSAPRLLLLVAWLIALGGSLFTASSGSRRARFVHRAVALLRDVAGSERSYCRLRDWLVTAWLVSWGAVGLLLLFPAFWVFVSPILPVLLSQYMAPIALVGLLALELLALVRYVRPDAAPARSVRPAALAAVLVFLLSLLVYVGTAARLGMNPHPGSALFPELAQAFLDGRLDLQNPTATKDLTLHAGRYYVAFPPLGALLMMPTVAFRGPGSVNVVLFNSVFGALGVVFTFLCLEGMHSRGMSRLRVWEHAELAVFLGFGTAQFFLVERGLVNFSGQVLATTFLALALWLVVVGAGRSLVVGGLLAGFAHAFAIGSRPIMVLAWLALAGIQVLFLRRDRQGLGQFVSWAAASLAPVMLTAAALAWYNNVRFGSPLEFGYRSMLVADALKEDLGRFGLFHTHFIAQNIFDNFLRLPYWDQACRHFTPQPQGTSLFVASPLLAYLYVSLKKNAMALGSWLAIGSLAVGHALYYNSGAVQFGYRFSLDFMPIALAIMAAGFKERLPRLAHIALVWSICANYIGVLWITHRWCVNF